jgi:hypothetical protein
MEHVFWIPFVIIVGIVSSYLIGGMFREWNEGKRFERNDTSSKNSFFKTILYGLLIIVVMAVFFRSC